MLHTERNSLSAYMTSMSVTHEKTSLSIRFCRCCGFKTVNKPLFSNLIVRPSSCIRCEVPVLLHVGRDPCRLKVLAFKNNQWWNRCSISTDAFNYRNPLLTSGLSSIDLLLTG